jgi:hypothetical protein
VIGAALIGVQRPSGDASPGLARLGSIFRCARDSVTLRATRRRVPGESMAASAGRRSRPQPAARTPRQMRERPAHGATMPCDAERLPALGRGLDDAIAVARRRIAWQRTRKQARGSRQGGDVTAILHPPRNPAAAAAAAVARSAGGGA